MYFNLALSDIVRNETMNLFAARYAISSMKRYKFVFLSIIKSTFDMKQFSKCVFVQGHYKFDMKETAIKVFISKAFAKNLSAKRGSKYKIRDSSTGL